MSSKSPFDAMKTYVFFDDKNKAVYETARAVCGVDIGSFALAEARDDEQVELACAIGKLVDDVADGWIGEVVERSGQTVNAEQACVLRAAIASQLLHDAIGSLASTYIDMAGETNEAAALDLRQAIYGDLPCELVIDD